MKSPPELWTELSELDSLARHLGEFGEIRITKVDPESRVEWEADRASGTVRLEPSGWGTRVVLTVDTPGPEAEPAPDPEPVVAEAPPAAVAAEPEPEPEPEPEREPVRRGWLSRLFRRAPAAASPYEPVEEAPPEVVAPEPEVVAPEPEASAGPEPEGPVPPERAFGTIEWETPPEPVEENPEPAPIDPGEAHAVLTGVLDTLGAAHHRPFSRP